MPNSRILIGPGAHGPAPTWSSAEQAAQEYFFSRITAGAWVRKPPVERWSPDQREAFEVELTRLEEERDRQRAEAVEFATKLDLTSQ